LEQWFINPGPREVTVSLYGDSQMQETAMSALLVGCAPTALRKTYDNRRTIRVQCTEMLLDTFDPPASGFQIETYSTAASELKLTVFGNANGVLPLLSLSGGDYVASSVFSASETPFSFRVSNFANKVIGPTSPQNVSNIFNIATGGGMFDANVTRIIAGSSGTQSVLVVERQGGKITSFTLIDPRDLKQGATTTFLPVEVVMEMTFPLQP
jgi:hypothetical protein